MILFLHQNRFGEMYHYITCSPMDPLQWMGAVRMRVQTADKNITIIHTTPVHQLTSYELKSCMFIRNKLIKTFQTSNCFFQLKSIILFPQWKSHCLNQERTMHNSNTICKWKQSKTILNKYIRGFFVMRVDNRRWTFSQEEALFWILDNGLIFCREAMVKML